MLGFTTAVALATGIVFGLAPALRSTRLNLTEEFQGGPRSLGGSRSTLAHSMMVVQVALSLVLLVGAGLFVRTLRNLHRVDVGFNRESLLFFEIFAPNRLARAFGCRHARSHSRAHCFFAGRASRDLRDGDARR